MGRAVSLDPITFEVIRNALVAATDEMVLTLRRAAYSTNIKTRSDFSCAFFDAELRAVAQGFTQPVHLGSMVKQVLRAIEEFGPGELGPGDVIITNDPFPSGVHLNDVSLISPVHVDGELLGYVANLAHHVDVGGGAPASVGAFKEVFQEGVIIPPVRVVAGGRIVEDVFALILAQIRSKHETAGDFRAQIAANATGVRRLQALAARHGRPTVVETMQELLDYTERRTRAELAALPRGTFEAEGTVDVDGYTDEPVRLQVRVEIGPDGVRFDTGGSDLQRRAPVNSTLAQTFSACAYALKCLIDPDLPVNDGFYRLVRLDAPAGTVTNCSWPSPVVGGWETQTRLVDVVFKALIPVLPERLPAGTKAMMCHAGFGGVDPVTNAYTCFLETFAGGYGGRAASDGPDAVQAHGQNTENAPVEETELNYPVRIARLSLVEDSDGAGRFRGGLGLRKDFLFDRPTTFTVLADRTAAGPQGAFGGHAGGPAEYVLLRAGVERRLPAKTTIELEAGDVVSYRTCGGGGYGPPEEREPERVLRDVLEGKVSAERARDVYRVAVRDGAVDGDETTTLRGGRPTEVGRGRVGVAQDYRVRLQPDASSARSAG
ncbi:MAG: hydantoinase B/oxoprolinase family protein [Actinobacteria bacterium]|nr:hydantoinase B/oxoprolinase family protein [Actinomycetota bacterium]